MKGGSTTGVESAALLRRRRKFCAEVPEKPNQRVDEMRELLTDHPPPLFGPRLANASHLSSLARNYRRTVGRTLGGIAILLLTSERDARRQHGSPVSREAFTRPPLNLGLADYSNYAIEKIFYYLFFFLSNLPSFRP